MTKVPSYGTEGIVLFMGINGNSDGEVPWRIRKINIYIYIWREIFGGFSVKKRVSEEIGESVWERIIRVWKSEVEVESSEDDWGGAERSAREEGESEVQRGWHHRRPEETRGGADGYPIRQDPDPEVVQHL